jgi:GNAT superfamily N-acetyltransferase
VAQIAPLVAFELGLSVLAAGPAPLVTLLLLRGIRGQIRHLFETGISQTDRARMAWIGDVFVPEQLRGRGLGVWLVETTVGHPDLRGLRLILATADVHGLYRRFGFTAADSERMMERPGRVRT